MKEEEKEIVNCRKHGRLIVATLDPDTEDEQQYCVSCVRQLVDTLKDAKLNFVELSEQLSKVVEDLELVQTKRDELEAAVDAFMRVEVPK